MMDGFLYEGLLGGGKGISLSYRGLEGVVWRESEGLCYRVDDMRGCVGVDLFVSGYDFFGKSESFDDVTM